MLRTRYHPNIKVQPNVKLKGACTIINIVHNDNSNKKNSILNNRSNKFLSIPERQRIIREINESKNQINFQFNLDEPFKREKMEKKRSEDNKSLLYVKKVKSDLNYDIVPKNNNKIIKNNRNSKIGNFKFTDNREFVHKAIKEYYKKIDNSFKNYLHNLNNRSNDNKIKNQKSYFNNTINSNNDNFSYLNNKESKTHKIINIKNNKISLNRDKNVTVNEIYKKPNLSKIYNKVNANNVTEENKNHIINENDINNNNIYLDNFNFINSARKEKINCTKMINNKNGDKKLIFNKINNYNTTTFRNNSKNDKSAKMHFNNSKPINNHLLSKNNSTSNFMTKINKFKRKNQNNDMINQTDFNLKKKDFKKKYKLDIVQTTYCGENINNIINENIKTGNNNDNNFINEPKDNKILLYSNNNDYNLNSNLKYTKKNIKSPIYFQNKKRLFKSNFMSNDLPKIIIENDTISFMSPYDHINNEQKANLIKNQDKNAISIKNLDNQIIFNQEENPDNIFDNNFNQKLPEKRNKYKITEIKTMKRDKSLTFSFEESPNRDDNRKNRSFSYIVDRDIEKKDDNYNFIYKNRRHHYTYKKLYPSIKEKNVYKYNYIRHKSKCMRKDEIFYPNVKNRNKKNNYYNSDDDVMNSNSCNNSSNNILGGIKNKSFDFNCYNAINSNNNIFNIGSKNTLMKEYYFNYFSNKINNDFLDENKFNKFELALLKKKSPYSKNKSNFGLSESIDSYNNSCRKNTPLKSILNSYNYKKSNDNVKNMIDDRINNKRHNKTDLISNKIYLKTDIHNEKYNQIKKYSNIKNLKNGSQFSKKLEIDFKTLNFDTGRNTNDNFLNKNLKNEKENKEPMKIQEIKIEKIRKNKEQNSNAINIEVASINLNINNKDIENKLEKAKLLKENSQLYKISNKVEMNNPINDEFLFKDNYSKDDNKIKGNIGKKELKNEEEEGKSAKAQKNKEKIDDIIDNNLDISPIPTRNSFIKEDNDNIICEKTETENNIKVETEEENNDDENNIINNLEEPIKQNYSNTKLSSIALDLLEYIKKQYIKFNN